MNLSIRIARWAMVPGAVAILVLTPTFGFAQTKTEPPVAAPSSQTAPTAPAASTTSAPAMPQDIVVDIAAPSFVRPEIDLEQGLGRMVDQGGPAIKIELFQQDD